MLIRLLPLVLIVLSGLVMWHLSARSLARQLSANSRPLTDPGLAPLIEALRHALGLERLSVFVYQIGEVNGLAAPDGRVFLTEGFLQLYRDGKVSAEELASVIAHELGHVARGHARRRMIDVSGHSLFRFLLAGLLGRVVPVLGGWLADLGTRALMARFSQRDEYEADAFASALLLKAGIGIAPQLSLLAKLDTLSSGGPGPRAPAWLASHPETEARIKAIRANAARWGATDVTPPERLPR